MAMSLWHPIGRLVTMFSEKRVQHTQGHCHPLSLLATCSQFPFHFPPWSFGHLPRVGGRTTLQAGYV